MSPSSIFAVPTAAVDPRRVWRALMRTSFSRRFGSVFDRLSQGATAGNAVVPGFLLIGLRESRLKTAKTVKTVRSAVATD